MDIITNNAFAQLLTTEAITAVTGILAEAEIALFQNDVVPNPALLLAAYDLADYSGYAEEAITWGAVSVSDDGVVESIGTVGEFRPTSSVVTNAIYGGMLWNSAGALLGAFRLENPPVGMAGVLDVLLLTIRLRLTPGGLVVVVS